MQKWVKVVSLESVKDDFEGVFSGRVPVGYISHPISSRGYPFILKSDYRNLALNNGLFVLFYDILNMDGFWDSIIVLCCASEHQLSNPFQEQENRFTQAFRRHGNVDTLVQMNPYDDAVGILIPISAYSLRQKCQTVCQGLPPGNTSVYIATEKNLAYFYRYPDSHCRFGKMLGTNNDIGLIIRHFGDVQRGGWGDARMMGIFGATGSGKTRFAGQVLSAYSRYPEMGILIIDPQGQFSSRDAKGVPVGCLGSCEDGTDWELRRSFAHLPVQREVTWINVEQIAFSNPFLFAELLKEKGYFKHFYSAISSAKLNLVTENFYDYLENYISSRKLSLSCLNYSNELYLNTQEMMCSAYSEQSASSVANRIEKRIEDYNRWANNPRAHQLGAERIWEQVLRCFQGNYGIEQIIEDVLIHHKIVIISLVGIVEDRLKRLYCAEILDELRKRSESYYHVPSKRGHVNALVAIDEVQRLVGAAEHESELNQRTAKRISSILIDCVKTTRKLSVGWLFITQTLRSIDPEIYRQLNTKVFGFGLATDGQVDILRNTLASNPAILDQYRTLPVPVTSGIYAFLTVGEMLPLGNGTYPIFINAYRNQTELFTRNPSFFNP